MSSTAPASVRAHCNSCGSETNHALLAQDIKRWEDDEAGIEGSTTFEMLKCLGCDSVKLREEQWFSEWDDYSQNHRGEPTRTRGVRVNYFPPAVSRTEPRWISNLEANLRELLQEVYHALHADSRRLAVMGARAVVDLVIVDKVGDKGTFKQKVEALTTQGYLSTKTAEVLETALEAGHAASHRGHKSSVEEVNDVMDIVEGLLHSVYVNPDAAQRLKKATPPRPGV